MDKREEKMRERQWGRMMTRRYVLRYSTTHDGRWVKAAGSANITELKQYREYICTRKGNWYFGNGSHLKFVADDQAKMMIRMLGLDPGF